MSFLLLLFALMFLGSVGYLIKNGAAIAALFGKRRFEAEPGELIDGPQRARRASRGSIVTALAIHAIGLAGLIVVGALMVRGMAEKHPNGLPADMNPVDTRAG